ncbi:MAG TPA: guanitoxin biosynthesis PLP-dependent transaminase GntE [Anaerolineales bacterium]|nr:guanitoxin biosynthesis PLP-dependent transaminase GntE [Anaerolineales bacterium]
MAKRFSETKSMYDRACQVIPWGVSSNFRYWGEQTPVVMRGQGAYIWDVDGNRFIDYRLAFGPIILGHADPRVNRRVHEEMDKGTLFAHTHVLEVELAERMVRMCPGVEKVRFVNSGTEATMHALRIARAYTNREKVVKFEGNYHGFHDYLLFSTAYTAAGSIGSRRSPIPVKNSSGIPGALQDLVFVLPFNDFEMLEKMVKAQWAEIAAIIVEPIAANMTSIPAEKGWLELMRRLCDEFGIVMIVDEVKTGFRIARGGATEYFGVKGDLMTYAKSLANGFPLAALGGKKEVMDVIEPGRMAHGGTYCGNVLGTAAAVATLEILENTEALKTIEGRGTQLMEGIHAVLSTAGEEHTLVGVPAMFSFILGLSQPPREFRDLISINVERYELIHAKMRERGIEYELDAKEPWFVCEAHSDADVAATLSALEDSLKEIR